MSLVASHCCLLTCVTSALPRETTSVWPEIQKDFQCTICYLAPVTCVNIQSNRETLPLLQAPWPFLMVLADKGSATVEDGRIFEVGKGWIETRVQQTLYMFAVVAMTDVAKCTWL